MIVCLSICDLALTYSKKDRCFIGTGYKAVDFSFIKTARNWIRCTGNRYSGKFISGSSIMADNYKSYYPGFHIFLDLKSAVNYHNLSNLKYHSTYTKGYNQDRIIKVEYKNVIAYGKNHTNSGENRRRESGPCVVSEYIRYLETVPLKDIKPLIEINQRK